MHEPKSTAPVQNQNTRSSNEHKHLTLFRVLLSMDLQKGMAQWQCPAKHLWPDPEYDVNKGWPAKPHIQFSKAWFSQSTNMSSRVAILVRVRNSMTCHSISTNIIYKRHKLQQHAWFCGGVEHSVSYKTLKHTGTHGFITTPCKLQKTHSIFLNHQSKRHMYLAHATTRRKMKKVAQKWAYPAKPRRLLTTPPCLPNRPSSAKRSLQTDLHARLGALRLFNAERF